MLACGSKNYMCGETGKDMKSVPGQDMQAKILEFSPRKERPGPCPFCGSTDTEVFWQFSRLLGPMEHFVFCWSCRTKGPAASDAGDAELAWNRWSAKSCAKKQA